MTKADKAHTATAATWVHADIQTYVGIHSLSQPGYFVEKPTETSNHIPRRTIFESVPSRRRQSKGPKWKRGAFIGSP